MLEFVVSADERTIGENGGAKTNPVESSLCCPSLIVVLLNDVNLILVSKVESSVNRAWARLLQQVTRSIIENDTTMS